MKLKTSEFAPQIKLLTYLTRNHGYITLTSNTVSAVNEGIKAALNVETEDADGFEPITVFSKPFHEAVKKAKTEILEFDVKDDKLVMKSGRSRFKFVAVNTDEVNVVTAVEGGAEVIESTVEAFERLIDRVWYAAEATNEGNTRANLQGVHMHSESDKLVAVATDGHRLARYAIAANVPSDLKFTVPNNAIKVIKRFLDLKSGNPDLKIKVGTGKLNVSTDYGEVTTTLIEQEYPNYKAIMPDTFTPVIELDCERLSQIIDAFEKVMPEDKAVRTDFDGGEVTISAKSTNGSGEETLDYDGESDTEYCMFNGQYMRDALRHCECLIQFNADSPILLKGQVDSEYRALVMPMRVNDGH